MSAPLPCWISTRPIMTSAAMICRTTTTFINTCILMTPKILRRSSAGCLADGCEIGGLERGATDQTAIDIGLRKQLRSVVGLHTAAVENEHLGRLLRGRMQLRTQQRVHRLRLLWRCRLPSADGPHRFIGDDHLRNAMG